MSDRSVPNPRSEIDEAIATSDLPKLLEMSGLLHGHFCPFLAIGVKAAARAVKELEVRSTGMEEVVAIVETNSCFADGVQLVTGCSFGNNALIYRDFGKTAFSLARRNGEAVRVSVRASSSFLEEREPAVMELFKNVVVKRQGTEADESKLKGLWARLSVRMLDVPDDELFDLRKVAVQVPAYARIFASVKCSSCGENTMEPRARAKDGKYVCLPCSGQAYYQLAGDGMLVVS